MANFVQAVGAEAQRSPDSAVDVEPLLLDTQMAVTVVALLGLNDWAKLNAQFPHIIQDITHMLEDANENIKNPLRRVLMTSAVAPLVSKVGCVRLFQCLLWSGKVWHHKVELQCGRSTGIKGGGVHQRSLSSCVGVWNWFPHPQGLPVCPTHTHPLVEKFGRDGCGVRWVLYVELQARSSHSQMTCACVCGGQTHSVTIV